MRNIVALSCGESSAAVAIICRDIPDLILYFNDTGWEDADLHRYLSELSAYMGIDIVNDSDGRNVEEVAYSQRFLANNRAPLCSKILKAKRLQEYAKAGDCLYFGIGSHEIHRAARIRAIYTPLGINTEFPLIDKHMDANAAREIMAQTGIERPRLYAMGFEHNNCGGGCVRQGARQWRHLLRVLPDVYAERERFEKEFSKMIAPATFLKDISLSRLREIEEAQGEFSYEDDGWAGECIGMCGNMA